MNKALLLFLVICVVLFEGQCAHFEFSPAGSPCIIMDLDATFNLTKDAPDPDEAPQFDLQGQVVDSSSVCDSTATNNLLTITLTPTNERLQFKFSTNGESVFMSAVLNVKLASHFTNESSAREIEFETNMEVPIGSRNMSYQCSSMELHFDQDIGYHMTMDIKNIQVQAYDVGADYSAPVICAGDVTSTQASTTNTSPTTKRTTVTDTSPTASPTSPTTNSTPKSSITTNTSPKTTKPSTPEPTTNTTTPETPEPTNGTTPETPEPTNGTTPETPEPTNGTTPEMTTLTTPAPVFTPKFALLDLNSKTYCIVLQGNIQFQIPYMKNGSEELSLVEVSIPENATVSGSCSLNGTNTTQQINLAFFDGWMFSLIIGVPETLASVGRRRLLATESSYSWQEITLDYRVDEHFDDPDEPGAYKTVTTEPTFSTLAADGEGYMCNSKESYDLKDGLMMDVSDLQYRAFGDTDAEDLPTDGVVECDADKNNNDDDDDDAVGVIVGSVVGGVVFLVILIGFIMYIQKRRRKDYVVM